MCSIFLSIDSKDPDQPADLSLAGHKSQIIVELVVHWLKIITGFMMLMIKHFLVDYDVYFPQQLVLKITFKSC